MGSADKVIILVLANLLTFGPATSGEISSQRRLLFFFDKIEVNGEVDVFLSKGKRNREATIYADSEIIDTVLTKVSKRTLYVDANNTYRLARRLPFIKLNAQRKFPVEIMVSIDKLAEIRVHGGSNLTSAGLNSDKLSVFCSSTGKVHLENPNSPILQLRHEGSGVVVLRGKGVHRLEAQISGDGSLRAEEFPVDEATLLHQGKTNAHSGPTALDGCPHARFRKSHAAQETGKDGGRSGRKRNRERYHFGSPALPRPQCKHAQIGRKTLEGNLFAFHGRPHAFPASRSFFGNLIHLLIAVGRIVMEKKGLFDLGSFGHLDRFLPSRMPPPLELGIFLRGVGGVVHHDVRILRQGYDIFVNPVVVMLRIGTNGNCLALKLDSVSTSPIRMIELARANDDSVPQLKDMSAKEILERTSLLDQGTRHRKDRIFHQHGSNDSTKIVVVVRRQVPGMQSDIAHRIVKGREKRQTLNVIHMGVGEEQIGIKQVSLLDHDFFT